MCDSIVTEAGKEIANPFYPQVLRINDEESKIASRNKTGMMRFPIWQEMGLIFFPIIGPLHYGSNKA